LVPFLLVEAGGERSLERFMADTLEDSLEKAREAASSLPPEPNAYALAHDGYLHMEGRKFDAVFVEGAERGKESGFILTQRYSPKLLIKGFRVVGNPAFLGKTKSYFGQE